MKDSSSRPVFDNLEVTLFKNNPHHPKSHLNHSKISLPDRSTFLSKKKDSPQSVNTSPKLQASPPPILTAGIHQVINPVILNPICIALIQKYVWKTFKENVGGTTYFYPTAASHPTSATEPNDSAYSEEPIPLPLSYTQG